MKRFALLFASMVCAVPSLLTAPALATRTMDQRCQRLRYLAAAKYAECQQMAVARFLGGDFDFNRFDAANRRCTVRYARIWDTKMAKIAAAPCNEPQRFEDNGDGTVTDHLSGLMWEQQTDDETIHDRDNSYSWSAGGAGGTAADGAAFTTFLATLNDSTSSCFAGHCDWQLPTWMQLATIRALSPEKPYDCVALPCADQTAFGQMAFSLYWSSTTFARGAGIRAWYVSFNVFGVGYDVPVKTDVNRVVAVRGGL